MIFRRDYQVGNVNRRQAKWIAVAVTAVVMLAAAWISFALSQIGGGVANASPRAPIDIAAAVVAAEARPVAPAVAAHEEPEIAAADDAPRAGVFRVNLNSADASQLEQVPGLGKVKVRAMIAWRSVHAFVVPADLMKVKGFGPASYAKVKEYLAVDGPPMVGTPPKGVPPRANRGKKVARTRGS